MIREATAMEVRQTLGELLNVIQYRQDQVLITKSGKPVAAMIDVALFDKIRLMRSEFGRMTTDLAKVGRDVPADAAENEIAEAVAAVRKR